MVSTYDHANHILHGRLDQRLREMRAEGLTYDAMAEYFKTQGIPVTRQSVHRWVKNLETEAVAS